MTQESDSGLVELQEVARRAWDAMKQAEATVRRAEEHRIALTVEWLEACKSVHDYA